MQNYLIYSHISSLRHLSPAGHPERKERYIVAAELLQKKFAHITQLDSPEASDDDLLLVHSQAHIDKIRNSLPSNEKEIGMLDSDTCISKDSLQAAKCGAGGAISAVEQIATGKCDRAFVLTRPPGHHAEPDQAMGFCFFSNAALAAKHAILRHKFAKVAILDFDVHHGNGTQAAVSTDPNIMFASTHQMPLYPGTGYADEVGCENIVNRPLSAGTSGAEVIKIWQDILEQVAVFSPELIVISAGFDAHVQDPLAHIEMQDEDFYKLTTLICELADKCAHGRVVSLLEGGYHLEALTRSLEAHLQGLFVS